MSRLTTIRSLSERLNAADVTAILGVSVLLLAALLPERAGQQAAASDRENPKADGRYLSPKQR